MNYVGIIAISLTAISIVGLGSSNVEDLITADRHVQLVLAVFRAHVHQCVVCPLRTLFRCVIAPLDVHYQALSIKYGLPDD